MLQLSDLAHSWQGQCIVKVFCRGFELSSDYWGVVLCAGFRACPSGSAYQAQPFPSLAVASLLERAQALSCDRSTLSTQHCVRHWDSVILAASTAASGPIVTNSLLMYVAPCLKLICQKSNPLNLISARGMELNLFCPWPPYCWDITYWITWPQ